MSTTARTIAVSGASGLIGSHLLPALLGKGLEPRVLDRHFSTALQGVTQIQGDIRSPEAARDLVRGASVVVHLAAIAHTNLRTPAQLVEAEQIAVVGTRNILAESLKAGVGRVILVSSALVYAGQQGIDLDERCPTAADSPYARTKLLVEQAGLEAAQANHMAVIIVRPCIVYGEGARANLHSLMRAIHAHYYFHIRGANPIRSLLSIGNAVAALCHLLYAGENGCIYNLADRSPLPLVDFVNSLADLMQVARPAQFPAFAVRAGIAALAPLRWLGLESPINAESLRKLTVSFTLNVGALASLGFRWPDDEIATRRKMVDAYLQSLSQPLGDAPNRYDGGSNPSPD